MTNTEKVYVEHDGTLHMDKLDAAVVFKDDGFYMFMPKPEVAGPVVRPDMPAYYVAMVGFLFSPAGSRVLHKLRDAFHDAMDEIASQRTVN